MDYVHVLHTASLQTFFFTLQVYPCTNDKECEVGRYCHSPHQASSACMLCRRKKKRCHRDGMCCPGNRCNNGICVPVTENILTPHIPALDGPRNKKNSHYASKDLGWQNLGRAQSKLSHIKGKITLALHQSAMNRINHRITQVGRDLKDHQVQSQPNHSALTLTTLC
ncbi:hypothetical protein CIB84_005740 [Bambusicola thoracicus]|uniref:Dickkopf N-terminal cysteine-rich domain-containing protein n=1 Tax=Bambusicola thoracicus TaxID=9083 RepID=A0A2P4T2A7_BAMTH|nr:hypothetical protein CIB84_005740 [Bambusicola thoracicus]